MRSKSTLQPLSKQEDMVLTLAEGGNTDKQIALKMGLSIETIRTYWQRIRRKVGGATRSEIVAIRLRSELGSREVVLQSEIDELQRDIEKRDLAMKRVQRAENLMRSIMEGVPDAVVVTDRNGAGSYFNSQFESITGIKPNRGLDWTESIREPARTLIRDRMQSWDSEAGSERLEFRMPNAAGLTGEFAVTLTALRDEGAVIGTVAVIADLTAQARATAERDLLLGSLRVRTEQLQKIAELSPDLIYLFDIVNRKNLYANRSVAEMLGYTPDEVKAMGADLLVSIIHPDDFDRIQEASQRQPYMADGEVLESLYRVRRPDGTWSWLLSRDVAFERGTDGLVCTILGTAQDQTKLLQRQLGTGFDDVLADVFIEK
ncbi:MAG: PAS domain S-box protein [Fimbriimonas sp.]